MLIKFLRWEISDPIKLIIFVIGSGFLSLTIKEATYGNILGAGALFEESVLASCLPFCFSQEFYIVLSILVPLLVGLSLRYDRDSGTALTFYTLPFSKGNVFLIKFLSSWFLTFLMVSISYFTVVTVTYSSIPSLLIRSFLCKGMLISLLLFIGTVSLYTVSISSFFSCLSPNTFIAVIASFIFLYSPLIIGTSSLPYTLWTYGLNSVSIEALLSMEKGFFVCTRAFFDMRTTIVSVGFPLILAILSFLITQMRDVQ